MNNTHWTNTLRVCNQHFKDEMFVNYHHNRLKDSAVPLLDLTEEYEPVECIVEELGDEQSNLTPPQVKRSISFANSKAPVSSSKRLRTNVSESQSSHPVIQLSSATSNSPTNVLECVLELGDEQKNHTPPPQVSESQSVIQLFSNSPKNVLKDAQVPPLHSTTECDLSYNVEVSGDIESNNHAPPEVMVG